MFLLGCVAFLSSVWLAALPRFSPRSHLQQEIVPNYHQEYTFDQLLSMVGRYRSLGTTEEKYTKNCFSTNKKKQTKKAQYLLRHKLTFA